MKNACAAYDSQNSFTSSMQAEEAAAMQDDAGTDAAQNADTALHAAPPPASSPDPSYTPSSAESSPAASEENENLLDGLSSDEDMAPASTASDDSKANYRREIVRLQEVAIRANEATAAAQAAAAQARQEAIAAEERAQTAEALHQSVAEQLGRSDAVIAGMQGEGGGGRAASRVAAARPVNGVAAARPVNGVAAAAMPGNGAVAAVGTDVSKLVNKPPAYSGVTSGRNFEDWLLKMQQYLAVTGAAVSSHVALAATYLEGEALRWWSARSVSLQREGQNVASMEVFVDALRERFAYKNPEVQARNRLLGLKQGSMSVTDYINEFDSCYNHLPSWDEQEKVHKFLSGLNKTWKERCWINPLTGKRWTTYYPLANHLVSLLSETGILTDALQGSLPDQDRPSTGQGRAPAQQQASKRGRSRSRDRAGGSYAAAAQRGQSTGARPGHGQQPNRQGFGSPDNMRTYKNKKGQSFQRNAHLVSWMVKKDPQPCWCCYTPGHQVKDCTASPARGNPPGYVPPQ
jgi:hypothetical protein